MAVELDDWLIVNVYAPAGSNHKAERERFFEDLAPWLTNHISIVLAGDFNCVLNPARDRVKHRRKSTGPTESVMLERLKNRFDMTDAMNLVSHVEDEQDEHDPLNYYSYWKHDGASRLDRFYVTGEPYDQVQWVEAVEAAHDSDHREVRMELSSRGAGSNTEQSSVVYPIHTGRPQRVHDAIAAGIGKLMDTYETSKHPVKDWDGIITGLQRLLQDVKLADARQRKRYFANPRASTRNVFSSRAEIRTYEQEAGKRKATRSFGSNLQVSEENTRRFFKRNSDWQRDQTITRIVPSAGHFYSEDFPIEERMASEWSHVLSQSHATTSSSNYENEFNKFVRIPTEQQLTQNDAHRLVAPISEGETLDAIASLKRHKTAGTTGLNHDFYNYFAAELAPGLTLLFNAILNGEGVPESFLQATVAPLRKKGDSPDAMDYRPIALLNTAYKVFGRILADRLHCYLPRLISQSQQGFVRGRSIDKTITILKTILARSKADPLEAWTEAAMVLCLDLRKAYDTLDRNFMQQVLRRYGFSTKFIRVVHALHAGTTARFLVNGRTSQDWVVNSGIRQGCPLAPLLFILAVDTLGQAINRHPQLQGIPVPGSKAKRHKFSAFVDDSTVFLRSASELDTVTTILKQFGDLSGLRVQPSKSVIIGLNTVGAPTRWHGFPVQEPGATSRQLGYWVGNTAAIAENWKIRIEKTDRN
ncbi:hypothetical protein PR003_g23727 [Phytophthora rubi]|uniref:Reverse transcriptase domain-containing protein n=1 Tax=Phytophthora rubi TaxID=129364 RepID=A0A6A4CT47_9STRA|nr:hypothetical protein PR003_g23727 [Phytophthora rubi]